MPQFVDFVEECSSELGEEVQDLAKQYLKDAIMEFEHQTKRYNTLKNIHEELLTTEITVEFLANKGFHVKNINDRGR